MNKNDAAVIKVLSDLNLRPEIPLTPEQEHQIDIALDTEQKYLDDILKLFTKTT